MKTRVHIHKQSIAATANRSHFIVTLPRDVENVIGIQVSTNGMKKGELSKHPEAGLLRILRDGVLLYEMQVRQEFCQPNYCVTINSPSIVESDSSIFISGGHSPFVPVNFPGQSRALFCRFDADAAPFGFPYTLTLYFIYARKESKQ